MTAGITCIFLFVQPVKAWVQTYWWMYIVALGVQAVFMAVILSCGSQRRRFPVNFVCLVIVMLTWSFVFGTITGYFDTHAVLMGLAILVAVCVAISIFTLQLRIEFTMCIGLLYTFIICLLMFGVAYLVEFLSGLNIDILECIYGGMGALVISMVCVWGMEKIFYGRSLPLSAGEYISGAVDVQVGGACWPRRD